LQRISKGWKAYQKSFSSGREHAREALDLFAGAAETLRETEDSENLPLALDGMGAALHLLGSRDDLLRADKCYGEEIRLLERAGNPQELVQAVSSRQAVLRDLALLVPESAFSHLEKGLKLGNKGMTLAAKMRDERSLAWVSQTTADLCCVLARLDRVYAAAHLEAAVDLYQKAIVLWDRAISRGRPKKAPAGLTPSAVPASRASQAATVPREAAEGKTLALLGMAEARIIQGQHLDAARILLDDARDFYSKAGPESYQMGHVESLYGSLCLAEGDRDGASRHFASAAGIFGRLGFSFDRGGGTWKPGT
jgi:tetratricopeptide (TPR) repeat protein